MLFIFNLILISVTIKVSYTATYLGLKDPNLLEKYMNIFQIVPYFFLASLFLISLPLFFKGYKFKEKCDIVSLSVILIGIIYIFVAPYFI